MAAKAKEAASKGATDGSHLTRKSGSWTYINRVRKSPHWRSPPALRLALRLAAAISTPF
jgi:hypothetical protein